MVDFREKKCALYTGKYGITYVHYMFRTTRTYFKQIIILFLYIYMYLKD